MNDKNQLSNEAAQKAINEIRGGGYEKYVGQVLAVAIILSPLFLKSGPEWTNLAILFGVLTAVSWEQRWNQKRFEALIRYLENQGVLTSASADRATKR